MTRSTHVTGTSIPAASKNLHWLSRYARHVHLRPDISLPDANAIKSCFSAAAWRLLCRSDRSSFIPILRNRQLRYDSLVHYTQTLVDNGFQVAPSPELLDYFIQASYYFFDRMPSVPDSKEEMTLLRLATRHAAVSRKELQRVDSWLGAGRGTVSTRMSWCSVLRRANDWHRRQQLVVDHARDSGNSAEPARTWHFACGPLAWRGYSIMPLANEIDLWDEAQAMSSCLYKLRYLCKKTSVPSRFFSVRKNGRRYATLELVCDLPDEGMRGPDRLYGRWRLQDCRLSHNRLPSEALVKALIDFGSHYNLLSQRPGRAPKTARPSRAIRAISTTPMETWSKGSLDWNTPLRQDAMIDKLEHPLGGQQQRHSTLIEAENNAPPSKPTMSQYASSAVYEKALRDWKTKDIHYRFSKMTYEQIEKLDSDLM